MKKSKRIKKSNSWKIKQHRDQFFKKSKTLGYRSRASFKLIELNEKFKFLKKNSLLFYTLETLLLFGVFYLISIPISIIIYNTQNKKNIEKISEENHEDIL